MKARLKITLSAIGLITVAGTYLLLLKANQHHDYRVDVNITGSTPSVSIIYGTGTSMTSLTKQQLSWSQTFWANSGDTVVVVVTNEGGNGNSYTSVGLFPTGAGGVAAPIIQEAKGSDGVAYWVKYAP